MENVNLVCPLCWEDKHFTKGKYDTKRIIKWYNSMNVSTDRFFDGIDEVKKVQCRNCNLNYYNHHIEWDWQFYADLNKNAWYYDPNRIEFDMTRKYIKRYNINSLLEIGCWDWHFLDKIEDYLEEYAWTEINPDAIKTCIQKWHKIISEDDSEKKFDLVVSYQVYEHVNDAKFMIELAKKYLKVWWYLVLSVPNSEWFLWDIYNVMDLPPHHSLWWNKTTFEYLSQFDLELIECKEEKISFPHYISYLNWIWNELSNLWFKHQILNKFQRLFTMLNAKSLYQNSELPSWHSIIWLFKLKAN